MGSLVATRELAEHAYQTAQLLAVVRRTESMPPVWETARLSFPLGRPKRSRRSDSMTSQFDTGGTTRESHLIQMEVCHQASGHGSINEASSRRDDDS